MGGGEGSDFAGDATVRLTRLRNRKRWGVTGRFSSAFACAIFVLHINCAIAGSEALMLRLVTQDWTEILRERLREDAGRVRNAGQGRVEPIDEAQSRGGEGLIFGPYGSSPISGLHFDAADDTAAS